MGQEKGEFQMFGLRYLLVYAVLLAVSSMAVTGVKGVVRTARLNTRARVERHVN